MYTALERNRLYRIGSKELIYLFRDFPTDDAPAVFNFKDVETRELVTFFLEQLTVLEREGAIEYLGVAL